MLGYEGIEPRVGIEPTAFRLQGGCSAELSFKGGNPRRGTRTPNLLFVREALSAIELPAVVRCKTPRPDSNGRAWVRSPLLSSTELRGEGTEAAGLEPANAFDASTP